MDTSKKIVYGIFGVTVAILFVFAYMYRDDTASQSDTKTAMNTVSSTTTRPLGNTNTATGTQAIATTTATTTIKQNKNMTHAILTTNKGVIEVEFATDKPATVNNFVKLASDKFYDGVKFHRVIKGFMIQAGDPLSKDDTKKAYWGTGGPGYKFDDELSGNETYTQGTLAMANAGPNTNGSQFFIVTAAPGAPLPPSYTVFGKVVKGLDVALSIENVATDPSDKPLESVIIQKVELK